MGEIRWIEDCDNTLSAPPFLHLLVSVEEDTLHIVCLQALLLLFLDCSSSCVLSRCGGPVTQRVSKLLEGGMVTLPQVSL